jgi:hypothetical protein
VSRPTLYDEELQAKADLYVDSAWKDFDGGEDIFPSVEALVDYLNVSERSIYNWRDAHPEFMQTLERLKRKQKRILQNKSAKNEYNATISKLILSVNHGMVEKTATDLTSSDGSMKPTSIELIGVLANEHSAPTDTE